MSEPNIESIFPPLQPFLCEILKEKVGICDGSIELLDLNSGKPSWELETNDKLDDRLKLKIPLAGQNLYWEVVFNCTYIDLAPDFDLNDEHFFSKILLESWEEHVPSLVSWDGNNKKALFNVLSELRYVYSKYNVELMKNKYSQNPCFYQYASLLNTAKIHPDDIEVFVARNTVYFLILLTIDLSQFELSKDESSYKIALATSFTPNMTCPYLIMTPGYEELVSPNVQLPLFSETDTLGDFVLNTIIQVEEEIKSTFASRETKRKLFLFELIGRLGKKKVINYDAMTYLYANFILSRNGFQYVLRVEIPKDFPIQRPTYRFQSVYSLNDGKPFIYDIVEVPFKESWTVRLMVDKILRYLEVSNELAKFKDVSLKLFSLTTKQNDV